MDFSAVFAALFFSTTVNAEPLGEITSYNVPGISGSAYDVVEGSDGNLWMTQNGSSDKIWRFNPDDDQFTSYTVGTGTHHMTKGPNNTLWASSERNSIIKIETNGTVSEYNLPTVSLNGQLYGFSPYGLTHDPDGRIWVAGASYNSSIGSKIFRFNLNGSI